MKVCDLHTHSTFSDGTFTPEELIREAERCGLSAVALCDHNVVAGLPAFLEAARESSVEAIPGVELSTDYNGTELHILGLFLPPESFPKIEALVAEMGRNKIAANIALVSALQNAGYRIDYETIRAKTPKGNLNRVHIAAELVEKGYLKTIEEGFATILSKEYGLYREPKRLSAWEAIVALHRMGTAAVLAHPFLNLTEERLRVFLAEAKPYGLDGMETVYSSYDEETAQKAAQIAEEFDLKPSGGSDFHGTNRGNALGIGKGNLRIPLLFAEGLRKGKGVR